MRLHDFTRIGSGETGLLQVMSRIKGTETHDRFITGNFTNNLGNININGVTVCLVA